MAGEANLGLGRKGELGLGKDWQAGLVPALRGMLSRGGVGSGVASLHKGGG